MIESDLDSLKIFLFTVISAFFIIYYFLSDKKYPPGPLGLPLLGYLPFLGSLSFKKFKNLSEKYGNVLGLRLGLSNVVVLNDYQSIKNAFANPMLLDRPTGLFDFHAGGLGFAATNGVEWTEERRYIMRIIKDVGMGKLRWEDEIDAEIDHFIKTVSGYSGKPFDILDQLSYSVANNIMTLILGKRIPTDDYRTKIINDAVNAVSVVLDPSSVTNFFPVLAKFFAKVGISKLSNEVVNMEIFNKLMREEIEARKISSSQEEIFIDGYLKQMQLLKEKKAEQVFSEYNLVGSSQALVHGGSETTRTSLHWLFLAMASYPDIQQKIHDEISNTLGRDGKCKWSDRKKLIYTFVTIMEGQRWRTVAPLGLTRKASHDTTIGDFHIPKGTFVISNIWAAHNDPAYWTDPDAFKPERFLLEDGTLKTKKPESFIPFSLGRRNCPGETIAMMEIFRYFVAVIQKFKILPPEGHMPDLEGIQGVTYHPKPQNLMFVTRE